MQIGRLLFPALRWDERDGFAPEGARIEAALAREVGGFILFGGEATEVRRLTSELRRRSTVPLLVAADLERGAGQQFGGATPLPPVAALGALDDLEVTYRAAELTAREARALGVDWIYAPVADVDLEPLNPIVGTRAFGTDPHRVAEHVRAWIEGCCAGGALSCAKHFPGHGRTVADSHAELPSVAAERDLLELDLEPFRQAVSAGADSMMTAHVAYPALDPTGTPATLSAPIVTGLLRDELGYDGLVVTDALIMQGVLEGGGGEAAAAVRALAAGCDALLYPADLDGVAAAVDGAVGSALSRRRVEEAIARIERAAADRPEPSDAWGRAEDRAWALDVAVRTLVTSRGQPTLPGVAFDLLTVDDDVGGPYPPPARSVFPEALRAAGHDVRIAAAPAADRPVLVAVYSDIRAWKGRPGLSAAARDAVAQAVAARPDATIVLFAHPRLAVELEGANVLGAWGGEALMQEAAARWLAGAQR